MPIDSREFITDAQLVDAWGELHVKRGGIPVTKFANALRPVANMAIAAYVLSTDHADIASAVDGLLNATTSIMQDTAEVCADTRAALSQLTPAVLALIKWLEAQR